MAQFLRCTACLVLSLLKHSTKLSPQAVGGCRFSNSFHPKEPYLAHFQTWIQSSDLHGTPSIFHSLNSQLPLSTSGLEPSEAAASVLFNSLHFSSVSGTQGCLTGFEPRHVFWVFPDIFSYAFVVYWIRGGTLKHELFYFDQHTHNFEVKK